MEVKNCRKCGKIFTQIGISQICPKCQAKEDAVVTKVRDFIKENPLCDISDVSEATEVPRKDIARFLREKKIELVEGSVPMLSCEKCNKPIFGGRFCNDCLLSLSKELQENVRVKTPEPVNEEKKTSKDRMHIHRNRRDL